MAASFEDQVALACYDIYKKMGKKGKPEVGREWTKMSGIVQTSTNGEVWLLFSSFPLFFIFCCLFFNTFCTFCSKLNTVFFM